MTARLDSSSLQDQARTTQTETESAHFAFSEDTELPDVGMAQPGSEYPHFADSCLLGNSRCVSRVLRFFHLRIRSGKRISRDLLSQPAYHASSAAFLLGLRRGISSSSPRSIHLWPFRRSGGPEVLLFAQHRNRRWHHMSNRPFARLCEAGDGRTRTPRDLAHRARNRNRR